MRPWALGRKNWLFAGSLRSGQRAANIMTLIQSAKLNGLDPYAYLSDVLKRLPTHKVPHPNRRITATSLEIQLKLKNRHGVQRTLTLKLIWF